MECFVRNVVSWTARFGGSQEGLPEDIPKRNCVSWNAMTSGFAKIGDLESVRKMFDEMPESNVVSFMSVIDVNERNVLGMNAKCGHMNRATKFVI